MTGEKKFSLPTSLDSQEQGKKEKSKKEKRKRKKKDTEDNRSIRFNRNVVGRILSGTFFFTFFFMCIVCLMLLGRMSTMTSVANRKVATEENILSEVVKANIKNDTLIYEGYQFLDVFFNCTTDEVKWNERKDTLDHYLAKSLDQSQLENLSATTTRKLVSSLFIESKTKESETMGNYYELTYDVSFEENETYVTTQIILYVSYENNDFKLVNLPAYVNYKASKSAKNNEVIYSESNFHVKGNKVDTEERKKIEIFINEFFELYVKNDKSLSLISNVEGLNNAKLQFVTLSNVVRNEEEKIIVQGSYSFSYESTNELKSYFLIELEEVQDSYFVKNLN